MSEHGTTSRYTRGCRCARCRGANPGYQRAYQAKRKAATGASHLQQAPIHAGSIVSGAKVAGRYDDTGKLVETVRADAAGVLTIPTSGVWWFPTTYSELAPSTTSSASVQLAARPDPLDELVVACQDLREAFAAYHQALTQEPVA